LSSQIRQILIARWPQDGRLWPLHLRDVGSILFEIAIPRRHDGSMGRPSPRCPSPRHQAGDWASRPFVVCWP